MARKLLSSLLAAALALPWQALPAAAGSAQGPQGRGVPPTGASLPGGIPLRADGAEALPRLPDATPPPTPLLDGGLVDAALTAGNEAPRLDPFLADALFSQPGGLEPFLGIDVRTPEPLFQAPADAAKDGAALSAQPAPEHVAEVLQGIENWTIELDRASKGDPSGSRGSAGLSRRYDNAVGSAADVDQIFVGALGGGAADPWLALGAREETRPAPRWTAPDPPKDPLRPLKVGLVAAWLDLGLTFAVGLASGLAGYHPHGNYRGPQELLHAGSTAADAAGIGFAATVAAPLAEETAFRAVLIGVPAWALGKVFGKDDPWAFWVPAVAVSALFVAIHETQDPVLMGLRMAGALILARVYQKEGFSAAAAAHGIHNSVPLAGMLGMFFLGKERGIMAAAAYGFALFVAGIAAMVHLGGQRAERYDLELPRPALSPWAALAYAAIILAVAGFFPLSLKAAVVWIAAALALSAYAAWTARRR